MISKKNISLITGISIMLIVGVGGYYFLQLKQGKYPVSSFVSLSFKWGVGDTLANSYDSATGRYQYLDNKDKLVKKHVKMHANNIIFIHNKANELGFWELPGLLSNKNTDLKSDKVLRYEIVFNYKEQMKKVIYLTNYDGDPNSAARVDQLQGLIKQTLDEIEERYGR